MSDKQLNYWVEVAVLRLDIAREFRKSLGPDCWVCKKLADEAREAALRAYILAQP